MIVHHVRGAAIGIAATIGVVVGAVMVIVYMGYAPMAADSAPSAIEASLAMKALHAASERQMGAVKSPLAANDANLLAGLKTYQQNCVICHGAADGRRSNIAAGFYVPSPQFAKDGAEDDPEGATYWKIHHGIRFSAMPAFMHSLKDEQIWQVALFLKHMDALPKPVDAAWKATKSVGGVDTTMTPNMDMKR
jgi:mono/diheme cytochrome c family protein